MMSEVSTILDEYQNHQHGPHSTGDISDITYQGDQIIA